MVVLLSKEDMEVIVLEKYREVQRKKAEVGDANFLVIPFALMCHQEILLIQTMFHPS